MTLNREGCVGVLAACAALVVVAGGCGGYSLMPIGDRADFQQQVLRSSRPVLVDFYKGGGCPTCEMVYPVLEQLQDEYRGRVFFTKFEAMTPFFQVTSQTLSERYDIKYFPTVVLFVDGLERKRFVLDYNIDDYRKALDGVTRGPTIRKAAIGAVGSASASATRPL